MHATLILFSTNYLTITIQSKNKKFFLDNYVIQQVFLFFENEIFTL